MAKKSTTILAACGEHYVAAYLSGFQLIVALPRAGVPGCDLLVASDQSGCSIQVQVKTGTRSKTTTKKEGLIYLWRTAFTAIEKECESLWFAYVWINGWPHGDVQPEVFFIPSNFVAKVLKECQDVGDEPFFWMKEEDSTQFKGATGIKPLLRSLGHEPVVASET